MESYGILWLTMGIMALFVPVAYISGRKIGKQTSWVVLLPLVCAALIFLSFIPKVTAGLSISEFFVWIPGVRFGLLVDGLSLSVALTIAILLTAILLYSIPYMERRIGNDHGGGKRAYATYYALYLLYGIGMIGVAFSTNLFEFFLFYELMIVPIWAIINAYGYFEREKNALVFFLWMEASALLLLAGILIAYARVGNFEISQLTLLNGDAWAIWITIFMLAGLLIKMAIVGLHPWLPGTYAEAPAPISAALGVCTGLGTYGIVRLLTPLHSALFSVSGWLEFLALMTIAYGGVMALVQNDIKRLLAYSSISQMGYLLFGIASYTTIGMAGSMFHYLSHGLAKAILFSVAGAIIYRTGIRDIRRLRGLASRMPISATVFTIGFIVIAGVPPTVGFMSKWLIFAGGFQRGLNSSSIELTLAFAAMITTLLTIAYGFFAIRGIFYGHLPARLKNVKEAPKMMTIPLLILSVLSILLCIYPGIILDPLMQVINSLIAG